MFTRINLLGMGLSLGEVNICNGKARLCMKARLSFALARPRLKNVLNASLRRLGFLDTQSSFTNKKT